MAYGLGHHAQFLSSLETSKPGTIAFNILRTWRVWVSRKQCILATQSLAPSQTTSFSLWWPFFPLHYAWQGDFVSRNLVFLLHANDPYYIWSGLRQPPLAEIFRKVTLQLWHVACNAHTDTQTHTHRHRDTHTHTHTPKKCYSRDIHTQDTAELLLLLAVSCDLQAAKIFMRLIRGAIMWYHATLTSICNSSSWRTDTAGRVDVEPKLDIARYHMVGL